MVSGETPRARDFVGKGRLFGIGDKVESATFDYNGGSIVDLTPSEDYGSITNNVTTTDDLGSITSTTPGGEVDHGQIIITQTRQALTGLLQLQGTLRISLFVDLMLQDPLDSESSTNSRIQQTSDSRLIGDHVLTNKENSLAMPKLQEQEISLVLDHSSISVTRLRRQYSDILLLLSFHSQLATTMVQLPIMQQQLMISVVLHLPLQVESKILVVY